MTKPTRLTAEQLAGIRARRAAIGVPNWETMDLHNEGGWFDEYPEGAWGVNGLSDNEDGYLTEAVAIFIAAAPTDIAALLATVEALTEELNQANRAIELATRLAEALQPKRA